VWEQLSGRWIGGGRGRGGEASFGVRCLNGRRRGTLSFGGLGDPGGKGKKSGEKQGLNCIHEVDVAVVLAAAVVVIAVLLCPTGTSLGGPARSGGRTRSRVEEWWAGVVEDPVDDVTRNS